MKLCRFVLHEAPDQPRSGIYHDGKVYETDGERAIGIHDPGALSLLTPLGSPPALRIFQTFRRPDGEEALAYRFANVTSITGPNGEIEVVIGARPLDFNIHVVGIVGSKAEAVEPSEAPSFVLGYAIFLQLFDQELLDEERRLELPIGASHDFGAALGPYLTTPEDVAEFTVGSDPTNFAWNYRAAVNGTEVCKGSVQSDIPFSQLLAVTSSARAVAPGEVFAWPEFKKPSLIESPLERHLFPADRIEVVVDGLGILVARIA